MSRNTIKTFTLLAALAGVLVLVGRLLGGTGGVAVGFILGSVVVGGSYWFSDRIAIRAARAVPLDERAAPRLHADVRLLAARAGIPAPRLYLSPSPQPNAFATGRNERTAVIAVTQGLLDQLDPSEIRGVLAHELAHIANRDILIGSVAAAIATGVSALVNIAAFESMLGGDDDEAPGPLTILALSIVAPLAAALIQMAVSRSREFEADRTGAWLLGDGAPLAAALVKIERSARTMPMDVHPAQSSHYIVNPLAGRAERFVGLFRTHPPTEQRVARLLHGTSLARAS